jgi:hypothetical protein
MDRYRVSNILKTQTDCFDFDFEIDLSASSRQGTTSSISGKFFQFLKIQAAARRGRESRGSSIFELRTHFFKMPKPETGNLSAGISTPHSYCTERSQSL